MACIRHFQGDRDTLAHLLSIVVFLHHICKAAWFPTSLFLASWFTRSQSQTTPSRAQPTSLNLSSSSNCLLPCCQLTCLADTSASRTNVYVHACIGDTL